MNIARVKLRPGAAKLKELSGGREDDESDICVAENRELFSFFEKSSSSFRKRYLSRGCVVYLPDLNLLSRHHRRRGKKTLGKEVGFDIDEQKQDLELRFQNGWRLKRK